MVFIEAEPQDEAAVWPVSRLGTREEALHFDIPVEQGGGEEG